MQTTLPLWYLHSCRRLAAWLTVCVLLQWRLQLTTNNRVGYSLDLVAQGTTSAAAAALATSLANSLVCGAQGATPAAAVAHAASSAVCWFCVARGATSNVHLQFICGVRILVGRLHGADIIFIS